MSLMGRRDEIEACECDESLRGRSLGNKRRQVGNPRPGTGHPVLKGSVGPSEYLEGPLAKRKGER